MIRVVDLLYDPAYRMKYNPPPYVSEAAGKKIVIQSWDTETTSWLKSIGFIDNGANKYGLSIESDEHKAAVFAMLRERSICFSNGREWNPCEVFEHLRDQKLLSGTFKKISWRGPRDWMVRDR